MTNEDLIAELGSLFSLSVAVITRAAQLYAEIRKRGILFEIRSVIFRDLIPKIADGSLTPEAVSAFADAPAILQFVGRCDQNSQRLLASDATFPVVKRVGGTPVRMSVREMYPDHIRNVIALGRILTPEEQETQLKSRQGRANLGAKAEAKLPRLKANPDDAAESALTAEPITFRVASMPTEDETEELVEKINREITKRGGFRVTTKEFVEMVVMFGWGPIPR